MSCRIPDILLEAFLVVMVATILPTSLLLGVGFLLMWKKFHAPCISHTQNHYNCSFKCFKLSATCKTCRLALLILLLLGGSSMTSAEKGKPQLQPSYEYEAAKMTKVTINLTEQQGIERKDSNKYKLHKMKSSRNLRRQGEILQYEFQNIILTPYPFSPSSYWLLVFAYMLSTCNIDFLGKICFTITSHIQDWLINIINI